MTKTRDLGATIAHTMEFRMMAEFIERWGMVASQPDGEDAAGRQKLALLPPQAVVERAREMASELVRVGVAEGFVYPDDGGDEKRLKRILTLTRYIEETEAPDARRSLAQEIRAEVSAIRRSLWPASYP